MTESNFLIEKIGVGYGPLWTTFKHITSGASDAEKAVIYSQTAKRVYTLAV